MSKPPLNTWSWALADTGACQTDWRLAFTQGNMCKQRVLSAKAYNVDFYTYAMYIILISIHKQLFESFSFRFVNRVQCMGGENILIDLFEFMSFTRDGGHLYRILVNFYIDHVSMRQF